MINTYNELYKFMEESNDIGDDALSTTLFTMGLSAGLAFAEALPDTEAIFITTENEIYYTEGFTNGAISYRLFSVHFSCGTSFLPLLYRQKPRFTIFF